MEAGSKNGRAPHRERESSLGRICLLYFLLSREGKGKESPSRKAPMGHLLEAPSAFLGYDYVPRDTLIFGD
jgi:hypothetical protein